LPEQQARLTELLPELKRGRFIVEDDEVRTLRAKHNVDKYRSPSLQLTIAPTLGCNFRCIYCYQEENLRSPAMNAEVQQAILDYVSEVIKRFERLDITWFGGEPLLETDIIYHLSEELIKICDEHECHYNAGIITNGWLLSRQIAERLREYKVSMVQVTLDGPPEIHNARRVSKGGCGTFDRILQNVAAVTDLFHLPVRINVDKTNAHCILELYELLHDRQLLDKIHPYCGKVIAETPACADFTPCVLDTAEFAKMEAEIYQNLKSRRIFAPPPYPRFLSNYCGVTRLSSYVVDPLGRLYKCWNVIGVDEAAVGNILNPKQT